MSMPVEYYPPVGEDVIGQDAFGTPIMATKSSASSMAVSGVFLCVAAGAVALF